MNESKFTSILPKSLFGLPGRLRTARLWMTGESPWNRTIHDRRRSPAEWKKRRIYTDIDISRVFRVWTRKSAT